MYVQLWCLCLAAVSALNADNSPLVSECLVSGDKKSASEVALLKRLEPLKNKKFETTVTDGADTYVYSLVICNRIFDDTKSTNEGLVQVNKAKADTSVVGRINDTYILNGSDWIMLVYRSGDHYDSHCDKEPRKAMIMISCNKKTLGDGFTIISEERNKSQDCFYLFEMDSSIACPIEDSHLSVGSVLLIVFAVLLALYIIGGFVYQRFVVGAKGIEQFPNITFWQELGNLVADGCDFVCRSRPRSSETAYRGVGDDQLGEEPEERDDHLLPM